MKTITNSVAIMMFAALAASPAQLKVSPTRVEIGDTVALMRGTGLADVKSVSVGAGSRNFTYSADKTGDLLTISLAAGDVVSVGQTIAVTVTTSAAATAASTLVVYPTSGTIVTTSLFTGVPVRSNGKDVGSGEGVYQCVELIKRYYASVDPSRFGKGGVFSTATWSGSNGYAKDYYNDDPTSKGLIRIPNGSALPKPGDIVVFDAISKHPSGHVAIVDSEVTESSTSLVVVEQNWSSTGRATLTFDANGALKKRNCTSPTDSCWPILGFLRSAAPVNLRPIGSLDGVNGQSQVFGWAKDIDNPNLPVTVHLYIDTNAGSSGAMPIPVIADQFRSDVGNHAFNWSLPAQYQDGLQHQVWAWGIDLTDPINNNMQLPGSPRTFNISPPVSRAPTAGFSVFVGSGTGRDGQVVHGTGFQEVFDAMSLSSSPNGAITGWEWTFDNVRVGGSTPLLSQNVIDIALHSVSLVVVDSSGARSAPAKAIVIFDNPYGAWVRLPLASGPLPSRHGYAVAYDVAHRQAVLFGGYDQSGQALADTWLWDGITWTKTSPLNSPPARTGHVMVYDAAHSQVVLFGGRTNPNGASATSTLYSDTWTWNGSNWVHAPDATVNPPPGRWAAGATFDATRNLVVLFGGEDLNGTALGDMWVWDGSVWSTRPTGNLTARGLAESRFMTYDSVAQQTLVFGGSSSPGNYLNDMWGWNGMLWQQIQPSPKPPAMSSTDLIFNSAFPEVLLFGTPWNNGQALPPQTWTWRNQAWRQFPNWAGPAYAGPSMGQLFYDSMLGKCVVLDPTDGSTWMWNDFPF